MSMNYTKIWNLNITLTMIRFNIEQFIFNFPRYVMHSKSNVALNETSNCFQF